MCKCFFLASLKSMKKGVGSVVRSGSISQRYGSGDPDPDPHQNVTRIPNTAYFTFAYTGTLKRIRKKCTCLLERLRDFFRNYLEYEFISFNSLEMRNILICVFIILFFSQRIYGHVTRYPYPTRLISKTII